MDVNDACSRFTTDEIATTAFGIRINSFENPDNEFLIQNRENVDERPLFTMIVMLLLPRLAHFFRVRMFTKRHHEFLRYYLNRAIEERKISGEKRYDLIDTLVKLRAEAEGNVEASQDKLYDDMILAQGSIYYIAGHETTMASMSFTLWLLAQHPEIQRKLRLEMKRCIEDNMGVVNYDTLNSMEYLDMVVHESLRLYPVLPFLDREYSCSSDGLQQFSLNPYHNFVLRPGMPIFISSMGIHRDPKVRH